MTRAVLHVTGRVDSSTSPEMKRRLLELVDSGHRSVLLDLAGCEDMDPSGHAVITAIVRVLSPDGHLAIAHPAPSIARTLALSGLAHIIEVHASADLAAPLIGGVGDIEV